MAERRKINGRHPIGHESLSLNIIVIVIAIEMLERVRRVLSFGIASAEIEHTMVIYAKPENQWNSIGNH